MRGVRAACGLYGGRGVHVWAVGDVRAASFYPVCHFRFKLIFNLKHLNSTQNHGDGKREGKEKWPRKVFNFL